MSEESALAAVGEVLDEVYEQFLTDPALTEEQTEAALEVVYAVDAKLAQRGLVPPPPRRAARPGEGDRR